MPNRMLRDWTMSDKVDKVSVHAERFFTRLIMKTDDHGCYHADARILKANLYPLKLDAIREADLTCWMAECQNAGLIVLYDCEGKKYLQIQDFRQRLDKARSKFPLPIQKSVVNEFPPFVNEFPAEVERKPKYEAEVERNAPPSPQVSFNNLSDIDLLKEKCFADLGYFTGIHCTAFKISKEVLYDWLFNFNKWLRYQGIESKTEKDYRNYFGNWLSKQDDRQNPKNWKAANVKQPEGKKILSTAEQFKNAK